MFGKRTNGVLIGCSDLLNENNHPNTFDSAEHKHWTLSDQDLLQKFLKEQTLYDMKFVYIDFDGIEMRLSTPISFTITFRTFLYVKKARKKFVFVGKIFAFFGTNEQT